MSTPKTRWPLGHAEVVARELQQLLESACERIEVAGSIRRRKPDVGDIELLCIPKIESDRDLLGDVATNYSLLDQRVLDLLYQCVLDYRVSARGTRTFGPLNKLLVHRPSGIPVDIFSTSSENWGMALVVRTGPKEFNIAMMARFQRLGLRGHAYGGVSTADGTEIPCPTEETVFNLLRLAYLPPEEREG